MAILWRVVVAAQRYNHAAAQTGSSWHVVVRHLVLHPGVLVRVLCIWGLALAVGVLPNKPEVCEPSIGKPQTKPRDSFFN